MKFVRGLLALAVAASFMTTPVLRAQAEESPDREPAAAHSQGKHHNKKKKKKAAKAAKKHAAKAAKKHKASGASHYPTQPGGSGFADIPNEKKDDLPPPQNPAE